MQLKIQTGYLLENQDNKATSDGKFKNVVSRLGSIFNWTYLRLASIKVEMLLLVCVVLYAVIMCYLTLVKYYTFHATAWDLGVFSQSFYTTLNFKTLFYNNLELGSHFHVHFSPTLFLCLPFYAIYQSPVTLLVVQAIVVALGGVPLYYLARKEFGSPAYSIVFTALYLLYPALHGANLYDFHPEAFVPLFGFTAIYFFRNEKWGKYLVFLLLLLMVKEDMALVAMGIGFYGLLNNAKLLLKKRFNKAMIASLLTVLIGVAWLFFAFFMVSYFVRLDGYGSLWDYGYSHHTENVYGETEGKGGPLGVLSHIISNPMEMITQLSYLPSQKLIFFATLFLPLCMFAFLDIPSVLLFLPTLLEFMLASNPNYTAIKFHYAFQLTPTIFVATANGIRKISAMCDEKPVKKRVLTHVLSIMLVGTLITLLFTTPMLMQNVPLTVNEKDKARQRLISLIPLADNPHVLTQNDYFPQVSNSNYSYAYWNTSSVDYILIDICSPWFKYQDPAPDEYVAIYGEPKMRFDELARKCVESGEFGLLAQAESLLLYKRGYEGNLSAYFPYTRSTNWQMLYFSDAIVVNDPTSISQKVLLHRASDGPAPTFWYGPYLEAPPGEYEAKFMLRITNFTDRDILSLDIVNDFGEKTLAQSTLTSGNFSKVDVWQEFTLSFKLDEPAFTIEFRGMDASNATDIYLDCITLNQVAPLA